MTLSENLKTQPPKLELLPRLQELPPYPTTYRTLCVNAEGSDYHKPDRNTLGELHRKLWSPQKDTPAHTKVPTLKRAFEIAELLLRTNLPTDTALSLTL